MKPRSLCFNLEPAFRCNLKCEMCPRFSSTDPHLDMSMQTYEQIYDAMQYAHTVDFTGWGEPLLHPSIYKMVRMAREKGCMPTMTSNGTILNERNSQALIQAGMRRLAVSIDGFTPKTFEALRLGASFEKVTRNLQGLTQLISKSGSSMQLAIAVTIQESNAAELELIIPWMKQISAHILYVKQLNVISNAEDWKRSFLKYRLEPRLENDGKIRQLEEKILQVKEQAKAIGIEVTLCSEIPLNSQKKGRHCLATPLEAVYFSYEGKVAPCCHFGHHVSRFFEGEYYPPSSLCYGDIRSQGFLEVWNSPTFWAFRSGFVTQNYPEECRTCDLLYGK